jgi:hypothetical protein
MTQLRADHAHHTLAADDLAVAADFLDRSRNSQFSLLKPVVVYGMRHKHLVGVRSAHRMNAKPEGFIQ